MKFSLPSLLKSWRGADKNTQTTNIEGDNNTVDQSINIYITDSDDNPSRQKYLDLKTEVPEIATSTILLNDDSANSDEVAKIVEYRKISDDGDASTALNLLRNLETLDAYSTGEIAFRLHFNIGIILNNIGEYPAAATSLRKAETFAPNLLHAQSALAFADMLEGKPALAFDEAVRIIEIDGKHRDLCAFIMLTTAKQLGRKIDFDQHPQIDLSRQDVSETYLEYLKLVRPEQFDAALKEALREHPSDERFKVLWAESTLEDARQNQAFLLGMKVRHDFEQDIQQSATILRNALETALNAKPQNRLLISSLAGHAAIALRLAGRADEAIRSLDRVLFDLPDLYNHLAQVRATLFLQQDDEHSAYSLVCKLAPDSELQILGAEIEAKRGQFDAALDRINAIIDSPIPDDVRHRALVTKAQIGIHSQCQESADSALDELRAEAAEAQELIYLRAAYDRVFEFEDSDAEDRRPEVGERPISPSSEKLLNSLSDTENWSFTDLLHACDELVSQGRYREATEVLVSRVSFARESVALEILCRACILGGLASTGNVVAANLSSEIKNSVFGWKFLASVSELSGNLTQAVPPSRKLFERNPNSLYAIQWYVRALLRTSNRQRVERLLETLTDDQLQGTISEKREHTLLLVNFGQVERARKFAYKLFCENQNDHRTWMALSASVLALGSEQV